MTSLNEINHDGRLSGVGLNTGKPSSPTAKTPGEATLSEGTTKTSLGQKIGKAFLGALGALALGAVGAVATVAVFTIWTPLAFAGFAVIGASILAQPILGTNKSLEGAVFGVGLVGGPISVAAGTLLGMALTFDAIYKS
jgi:hypothetical protein